MRKRKSVLAVAFLAAASLLLPACTAPSPADDGELRVVTSTPVLADLASRVAGERAQVTSLIPNGADPHSYEPKLRDIRDVSYADLALTNGLLLEQNKLLKTMSANLPASAPLVSVGESLEQYGGELEPIVEDASLDSIWLGLRVEGKAAAGSQVRVSAVEAKGRVSLLLLLPRLLGRLRRWLILGLRVLIFLRTARSGILLAIWGARFCLPRRILICRGLLRHLATMS